MTKLRSLEAGRGIAAVAVVFHHASASANSFAEGGSSTLSAMFGLGYLGVDFFFVLSGFIIYYSSWGKPYNLKRFATGRLARIFLPYLPIGITLALAYTVLPALSAGDREWGWWATLTLLPSWSAPALSVAWTLQHELVFYALFAVLIGVGRIGPGIALWVVMICALALLSIELPRPMQFLFAPINLEFCMGVLAAHLFLSGNRIPYLPVLGTISVVMFFVLGADRSYSPLIGAGLAMFILWIATAELAERFVIPHWTLGLGAASYSIYLIHNPLLSITSRMFNGWTATLFGGVAVSLMVGYAYYRIWERPAQRKFRDYASARSNPSRSISAS